MTLRENAACEGYARLIREEIEALSAVLPAAYTRQWTPSPVPKPREDTSQRSSGERPSDPTADVVLDPRRLAVRESVLEAERALRGAARLLTEARQRVAAAVARYDGADK